jgi:hypothetical protein
MGARPLARKINELIKVPLSKKLLFDKIVPGSNIICDWNGEQINFIITPPNDVSLLENKIVDDDGFIVVE